MCVEQYLLFYKFIKNQITCPYKKLNFLVDKKLYNKIKYFINLKILKIINTIQIIVCKER